MTRYQHLSQQQNQRIAARQQAGETSTRTRPPYTRHLTCYRAQVTHPATGACFRTLALVGEPTDPTYQVRHPQDASRWLMIPSSAVVLLGEEQ